MKTLPTQDCAGCGKPYKPNKRWQRFCKASCRNEYHRERLEKARELLDQMEKQDASRKGGSL